MKFKALPITDLLDVTLDLEQLQARAILDQTPQSFLQLAVAATRKIAFGSTTLTFTASANATTSTVTHGLGIAPSQVFLTIQATSFAAVVYTVGWGSPTSTQFTVGGSASTSLTNTLTINWLAIG